MRVFAFHRFINISRLHRGMRKLKKPGANEITEPLVFIVYNVPGAQGSIVGKTKGKWRASPNQKQTKEQVSQREFKEAHVLAVVNKIRNERKKTYFLKTKTNRGESAAAWFHFGQWRIRGWKIIRVRSWKALSRKVAFFCFHRSHYFFFLLTANTSRDEAL